jgi:hypothetical protein
LPKRFRDEQFPNTRSQREQNEQNQDEQENTKKRRLSQNNNELPV